MINVKRIVNNKKVSVDNFGIKKTCRLVQAFME
jgi:hypothetical protein